MLNRHQILAQHRTAVRHGKRMRVYGPVQRAPNIDDTVAALEQLLGFVGQVVLDAPLRASWRLVDVHARHWRAVGVSTRPPDGMVEEEYAVCAGNALQEQFGHFRVVHALDFLFRFPVRVAHGRGDVGERGEGIVIKRVGGLAAADILDGHGVVFGSEVALGSGGWRVDVVPRLFEGYVLEYVGEWRIDGRRETHL